MSRKRKAPKKIPIIDPKYKSTIIPKLINSIMFDGKKTVAEKIVYDAIDKIKTKSNALKVPNAIMSILTIIVFDVIGTVTQINCCNGPAPSILDAS